VYRAGQPPTIELVRDALGDEAAGYLDFSAAGVDRGGYRFICPAAYLAAEQVVEQALVVSGPGIDLIRSTPRNPQP